MATCVMMRSSTGLELVYLGATKDLGSEPETAVVLHLSEALAAARARGCVDPVALVENQRMCTWKHQLDVEKLIKNYWKSVNIVHITAAIRQKDRAIKAVLNASTENHKSNERKKMAYRAAEMWLATYANDHPDQGNVLDNWKAAKVIRSGKRDMADALMMAIADADIMTHVVGQASSSRLNVLGMQRDPQRGVPKTLAALQGRQATSVQPILVPVPVNVHHSTQQAAVPPPKPRKRKHPVIDLTS